MVEGQMYLYLSPWKTRMYWAKMRLLIHIICTFIFFQTAIFCPAGGWASVPAAFPTVATGEGKPAGSERQWAGCWGSQGCSTGKHSLGDDEDSDHQRVRSGKWHRRYFYLFTKCEFLHFCLSTTIQVKRQITFLSLFLLLLMQSGAK